MRILHNEVEITKAIDRLDTLMYSLDYVEDDFIYIASDFPFNHLFVKLGSVVNAVSSTMKIEYYENQWNEVVEIRDETNGLFNDGFIEFTPNKDKGWLRQLESEDVGLTKVIYDKYWLRISFPDTLTEGVQLSFIGHKFSDDTDLFSEYPVFNDSNFMAAFKTGKTSWEEQEIKAAELIANDLQKKSVIISKDQILDRKRFLGASVCKTAEIIFSSFGNDYLEQKKEASLEYQKRLNLSQYSIDTNADGILQPEEIRTRQGWLSR
jgi:hypothetical protein